MTTKILCPTDGSDHANLGVQLAATLAKQTGAALTVCVVNIAEGGARGPTIHHWRDEEVTQILDKAEALAKADGVKSVGRAELISREAAPAIMTYAHENGFDHIVMGTGDKRGLKRLMMGSVATDVAAKAHCSVTVAR